MSKSVRTLLMVAALGFYLALPGVAPAASDLDINPMPPTFAPHWQPVPKSPGVEYAVNLPTDIFRYQDNYYFFWKKRLYQSSNPSGPWKYLPQEPDWFKGIDKSYFKMLVERPPAPPFSGARPVPPKPIPPAAKKPMATPPGMTPPRAASPPGARPAMPPLTPGQPPAAGPPKSPTPSVPATGSRPVTGAAAPATPSSKTPPPAIPPAQTPPAAAPSTKPAQPGPTPAKQEAPAAPAQKPKLPKAM